MSLDEVITAKVQSGVLPKSIAGARLGRGRGGRCAVCYLVIRHQDTEVAVEAESRRGVFHHACFNLWREHIARVRAPEAWFRGQS